MWHLTFFQEDNTNNIPKVIAAVQINRVKDNLKRPLNCHRQFWVRWTRTTSCRQRLFICEVIAAQSYYTAIAKNLTVIPWWLTVKEELRAFFITYRLQSCCAVAPCLQHNKKNDHQQTTCCTTNKLLAASTTITTKKNQYFHWQRSAEFTYWKVQHGRWDGTILKSL